MNEQTPKSVDGLMKDEKVKDKRRCVRWLGAMKKVCVQCGGGERKRETGG